jgi:dUTP pyrophosphatase|nr:MAG TPA: dUTPase [Caudoviricetes sp.]
MKFKVGDIVVLTKNYDLLKAIGMEGYEGCRGQIINIDAQNTNLPYEIQMENSLGTFWIKNKVIKKLIGKSFTIPIKYHNPELTHLQKIDGNKSDWIDLRAAEKVTLKKGEIRRISLGISMQLPENYEAHILPRSSAPEKFGIIMAHSQGIIDNSYCGDDDVWSFLALAIRDTTIYVNDRIAQFRIYQNQPSISFVPVNTLGNPNRGGFGSTGVK